jgi:hypothetical protein
MTDGYNCRFCLDETHTTRNPLISPCNCKGSIQVVHLKCLFRWIYSSLQEPREKCNICNAVYTYSITTLEERSIQIPPTIYYATSTPLAAAPYILLYPYFTHPSTTLICVHSLIASTYIFYIVKQVKNHSLYIWYYMKDWSIHTLALITVFTIMNRADDRMILCIYHFLTSCVWYTTQKVDICVRKSINNRIIKNLLTD